MRILFLNHTFPGPFQHLAAAFTADTHNTVIFAAEFGRKDFHIPGVQRAFLVRPKDKRSPRTESLSDLERLDADMTMALQRGRATAASLQKLRAGGFVPDLFITSAGMGNSLMTHAVFPESFLVGYGDWYCNEKATVSSHGQLSPAAMRLRNTLQLSTLMHSNAVFTSTEWQKKQFPSPIAESMRVIPLCVDADCYSPDPTDRFAAPECPIPPQSEIITAWSGAGEPAKQLLLFLHSLPQVLQARTHCHVVVQISKDSNIVPSLLARLPWANKNDRARVHIVTYLPFEAYRSLLRSTALYMYTSTFPTLSLSLLEAMSCACPVLACGHEAVLELLHNGENGFFYKPSTPQALAEDIIKRLAAGCEATRVGEAARRTVLQKHHARFVMLPEAENLVRLAVAK